MCEPLETRRGEYYWNPRMDGIWFAYLTDYTTLGTTVNDLMGVWGKSREKISRGPFAGNKMWRGGFQQKYGRGVGKIFLSAPPPQDLKKALSVYITV